MTDNMESAKSRAKIVEKSVPMKLVLDRSSTAYKAIEKSASTTRAGRGICTKGMSKAEFLAAFSRS